jgi:hypothetical protein
MAAPVACNAQTIAGGPNVTFASQMFGAFVQVHSDSTATAESAATLLAPITYSNTKVFPLIIGQGTLVRFIARFARGTGVGPTSPVIRVYGCDQVPDATTGAFPSGSVFWRLDNSSWTAAGVTLTLAAGTTVQNDGTTYSWSALSSDAGYSLRGAKAVLVLVETAASTTPAAAVPVYAQVLNV